MGIQIRTGALAGIDGLAVTVETDLSRGLPGFHLVGLPGTEVRESRDRVLAALRHCGIRIPAAKITVNLAPAGIRKVGASYDLAIAMSVICALADNESPEAARRRGGTLFLGELSLFGELPAGAWHVVNRVGRRRAGGPARRRPGRAGLGGASGIGHGGRAGLVPGGRWYAGGRTARCLRRRPRRRPRRRTRSRARSAADPGQGVL